MCLHIVYLLPPLRLFRLPSRCVNPLHIQSVLLPTPLGYTWPGPPLHCQTQFHNGPGRNKLCECVMEAGDIGIHLSQSRLRHHDLRQWYTHTSSLPCWCFLPISLRATLWWNPPNTLPMRGGHDPCLSLIHHYWMDHRQVDLSQGPGILTLSAQNPHQTRHFFCACQSLLTTSGQSSSAIDRTLTRYLNELNRARGDPIGCDFRLIPQYCLLLRQETPLPLLSPSAEVLRQVPAV